MTKEVPKELLEVLCCPECKGDLDYKRKEEKLACKKCKKVYKVDDGVPVML